MDSRSHRTAFVFPAWAGVDLTDAYAKGIYVSIPRVGGGRPSSHLSLSL